MAQNQAKRNQSRLTLLYCAASLCFVACSTIPVAPIGQEAFQPAEDEKRLWKEGRDLQERLDRSGLLYDNQVLVAYVNQIASRLVPEKVKKEVRFEVKVLRLPGVNAFALPQGAIYLHTGFLVQVENEAQVAAVLAHEISHVIHRHVVQGFRNLKQTAAFASTLAVVSAPAGLYGLGALALGTIGAMASISGYSQSLEEDADKKGLDLMVRAGYDPREAVKVFDKVKRYVEQEEIKEPYFFSTHPRLEERKESYERLLNVQYGERGGFTGTQEFMSKVAPVLLDNSLLELARGRFALAEASIEIFLGMEPGNPRARFALAELLRQRNQEGDQEKAEKEYKLAIAHDASFADPHRGLGLLYYKKAETELSRTYLQKYLSLNPAAKDKAYIEQYLEQLKTKREQP